MAIVYRPAERPRIAARIDRLALPIVCLVVGLLAAWPRLAQPDVPVTIDEVRWFQRSSRFAEAVLTGDAAHTFQKGHPGVTTMWIGALGMGLGAARDLHGTALTLRAEPQYSAFVAARRAMGLAQSVLLTLLVLVSRAFGLVVAATTGVLLALDPWFVANGRILHLDGLVSIFIALCAVTFLVRWRRNGGLGYALLGGLMAGLAVLTKSSALALLPPMLILLAGVSLAQRRVGLPGVVLDLALVAILATVVALVAWPALRAAPLKTVSDVIEFAKDTGGAPHENGNYFLGQAVRDPGVLFYPVALAFRLSPLVLLGAALWAVGLVALSRSNVMSGGWSSALLLLAGVLVVLVMGLGAKKFDRYILPAVPFLAIVAAVGYAWTLRAISRPGLRPVVLGAVGLAQLLLCAGARPYYFTYYSPLLGGATAAEYALPLGWGEGLDPAARYLNAQDSAAVVPSAAVFDTLRAQVDTPPQEKPKAGKTNYLLAYVLAEQLDQGPFPPEQARLALTVRIDGVDYVHLYALR